MVFSKVLFQIVLGNAVLAALIKSGFAAGSCGCTDIRYPGTAYSSLDCSYKSKIDYLTMFQECKSQLEAVAYVDFNSCSFTDFVESFGSQTIRFPNVKRVNEVDSTTEK